MLQPSPLPPSSRQPSLLPAAATGCRRRRRIANAFFLNTAIATAAADATDIDIAFTAAIIVTLPLATIINAVLIAPATAATAAVPSPLP